MGLGLAHKILDTFEKMDTINPTFELIDEKGITTGKHMKIRLSPFPTLTIYLGFPLLPIV